jgi:hypothetical protein
MQGSIGNWLILAGLAIIVLGLLVRSGVLGWFGHLPGDIRIEREGFQFYFPVVSMIVISIVLSAALAVIRRLF